MSEQLSDDAAKLAGSIRAYIERQRDPSIATHHFACLKSNAVPVSPA